MHPIDAIYFWAKVYPQRLAVVHPHMTISYRALTDATDAASERIAREGFAPRQPVAVAIGDPTKFLAVCFALLRNGIACAPVSLGTLAHLPANGINTLIHAGPADLLPGGCNVRFDDSWVLPPNPSAAKPALRTAAGPYGDLIFFTSGTTGAPKKVIMSAEAFVERVSGLTANGEATYNRILVLPGLGSVFGFNRAVPLLCAGKTLCFALGPEAQLRFINTFGVEVVIASIQQAADLITFLESGARFRSDSLKEVWISGGIASDELIRKIQLRLCRNVVIVYGSSESGFVAAARYDVIAHVPQAVGFVRPDMRVEIVDATNTPLPPGEEGLVRGQSKFIEKIFAANHPERASEAADAWWYPGDLGRLTADGILSISGRSDEVINMGGVKVAAHLLDEDVLRFPGVKDAGTCAVQGTSGMEECWIGIVPAGDIDPAALKHALELSRPDPIKIGEIFLVERIPRNQLGKLQRNELKALLLGIKSRSLA
jgi:acyl-coenzyme A synthetase/AMP-(fatty) acid ligase